MRRKNADLSDACLPAGRAVREMNNKDELNCLSEIIPDVCVKSISPHLTPTFRSGGETIKRKMGFSPDILMVLI
ncbi:MAG: hypothetical protein U9Q98_04180 [Bacteroidota bacterium]|nr:hypothetical protein [Bacteroidota bacterium]